MGFVCLPAPCPGICPTSRWLALDMTSSTEIAVLAVNNTDVYAQGEYLFPQMMAEEMGLDWNAQRQRIERSPWSEGQTCVTHVQVPGETQSHARFAMHQKIVPMWVASIDVSRVREAVRPVVEAWQKEIAEVLAEHYYPTKKSKHQLTDEDRERARNARRVRSYRKAVAGDGPVDAKIQARLLDMLESGDKIARLKDQGQQLLNSYAHVSQQYNFLGQQVGTLQQWVNRLGTQAHPELHGDNFVDPYPDDKAR